MISRINFNFVLILPFLFINIVNSLDNMNLHNNSHPNSFYDTKTYEIYYDDNEWDMGFIYPSVYINEPFENGWGFYFDLDYFDVLKNVKIFKIIEIRAFIAAPAPNVKTDEESRQVLCAGKGDRNGPKSHNDVFFAVPDDGIPVYEYPFEDWIIFTEKDGSWGTDDGAKYDYNGLPYLCKKEDCKNEYGYWLWVALTQVKSDGEWDDDAPNWIDCDDSVGHHCFIGKNYNWREYHSDYTCMIRLKIEIESGPGIESSSIGTIKALYR